MLEWHLWEFPLGQVIDESVNEHLSILFADWWGFSLTNLWWTTEGCPDCAAGVERC